MPGDQLTILRRQSINLKKKSVIGIKMSLNNLLKDLNRLKHGSTIVESSFSDNAI